MNTKITINLSLVAGLFAWNWPLNRAAHLSEEFNQAILDAAYELALKGELKV